MTDDDLLALTNRINRIESAMIARRLLIPNDAIGRLAL